MIRPAAVIFSLALSLSSLPAAGQEADAPAGASLSAQQIDALTAAIAEAVDEAVADTTGEAPAIMPLTSREISAVSSALASCWNIGSLSSAAWSTTVVVAVDMNTDASPVFDSIRLVKSSSDDEMATMQVYESARRAILRCGSRGFKLPPDQYVRWKTIELTFNPQSM